MITVTLTAQQVPQADDWQGLIRLDIHNSNKPVITVMLSPNASADEAIRSASVHLTQMILKHGSIAAIIDQDESSLSEVYGT